MTGMEAVFYVWMGFLLLITTGFMMGHFKRKKVNKSPWLKATSEGALYIDTSNPEWQKWFVSKIEELSKTPLVMKLRQDNQKQDSNPYFEQIDSESVVIREVTPFY